MCFFNVRGFTDSKKKTQKLRKISDRPHTHTHTHKCKFMVEIQTETPKYTYARKCDTGKTKEGNKKNKK